MVKGAWLYIVAAAAAAAAAGAQLPASHVNLLKYAHNNNGLGQYSFEFETSDGTYRREDGGSAPDPVGSLLVRGEYWFIDPEGQKHTIQYIADKNGFQPQQPYSDVRFNDRDLV